MVAPVEPLRPGSIPEASIALAAALHDDPLWRFLFPQGGARRRWLRLAMGAALRRALPEGQVYAVSQRSVVGAIALIPPGRYPLPAQPLLLMGLFGRVLWDRLPLGGVLRTLQVVRLLERLHIQERHWYVEVLGVHPSHQGQGLGRALLEPALARADRDGLPAYLETSNERNLPFYRRFGFEVREVVETPGGGPPIWTMLRPPVA